MGHSALGPSRDPPPPPPPPCGQPSTGVSLWFVKVRVRGPGGWFTYHSSAGAVFSHVLMRCTKLTNSPALMFCAAGKSDSVSFLCYREQSVLTANGCQTEAHLVFDRMTGCLGFIHNEAARRWTQKIYICMYRLCMQLIYLELGNLTVNWTQGDQSSPIMILSESKGTSPLVM